MVSSWSTTNVTAICLCDVPSVRYAGPGAGLAAYTGVPPDGARVDGVSGTAEPITTARTAAGGQCNKTGATWGQCKPRLCFQGLGCNHDFGEVGVASYDWKSGIGTWLSGFTAVTGVAHGRVGNFFSRTKRHSDLLCWQPSLLHAGRTTRILGA